MRVDIWSDVVCPFCYIGKKRLEAAAEQLEINLELHWHSFQLDPNAEPLSQLSNAAYLAEKYNRTLDEVEAMQADIAQLAKAEGLEFNWENMKPGNTFNAHRIIHMAQSKGLGTAAQNAFFYSVLTEGLAIDSRETLEDIAARIGLNPVEVDDVLDSNEFAEFVEFDQDLANNQLKVTGVPFFVFNQRIALAGAQPQEVFVQVLEKALALPEQIETEDTASEDLDQQDPQN
ncbi:DsbA family oxidoreductase [Acinetobacter pullicarnis]|uniref:DsbA family oxidoreductase n=1 Tax=Acinetobacter pullicarnis TaxID=2576829 RepID=UPI001122A346|nr:DsbA family oxidoreductase [Acinetobacter pullicarnis]